MMTRKERLEAIFAGKSPDRPAVKLWTAEPGQSLLHPAYAPVYEAAMEWTDIVASSGSPFNPYAGRHMPEREESFVRPTDSPEWVDVLTTVHTPNGDLRGIYRKSTCGKPGYEMEHLLKEPSDIHTLLSLPYEPYPFSAEPFLEKERRVADAGVVMFGLDHSMYALQRLIGSENYALWNITDPDHLFEAINVFAQRIRAHMDAAFDAGLRPIFGWVGPELCIPPLMSPADFRRQVSAFDKPLIEAIHERGGLVWVHCHGKMGPVLRDFIEMGVDVLNPIEPPPMGDITLEEAFDVVGDRMGLEGNIQTHDLMTAEPDALRETVRESVRAGRGGRRFILCPTSGYMEVVDPGESYIANLLLYIREGVAFAESLRE